MKKFGDPIGEWGRFKEWAQPPRIPEEVQVRLAELVASGNLQAIQFAEQLMESQSSGIAPNSLWSGGVARSAVESNGGGKSLDYSGLYKG